MGTLRCRHSEDTASYTALVDFKTFMYFLRPIIIDNGSFGANHLQVHLQLVGQGLGC